MSSTSSSRQWLEIHFIVLVLALWPFVCKAAPLQESSDLQHYSEGCYYNYNYYNEGDRILTNEPCLNCTCHNKMLMCYLRVCPFTKPIGHDCIIEKREDQCCPIITCPEVPVELIDHQGSSTQLALPQKHGCTLDGKFYPEGAQVPSSPSKPCELCYCIRNRTSCIMQECTLHVSGCQPIYHRGACCPVRYNCDYDTENEFLLEDETTTTVRPTEGFILTTTLAPVDSTECVHNGVTYADGTSIESDGPCEHCYCMRGDKVCAVQKCDVPLNKQGANCTALPTKEGECCPSTYMCTDMEESVTITPTDDKLSGLPEITTEFTAIDEEHTTVRPISSSQDLHEGISEEDVQLQQHIDDIPEVIHKLSDAEKDLSNVPKEAATEIPTGIEESIHVSYGTTQQALEQYSTPPMEEFTSKPIQTDTESSTETEEVDSMLKVSTHKPQIDRESVPTEATYLHEVDISQTTEPSTNILEDNIDVEGSGLEISPAEIVTEVPDIESNEIVPISIPGEGDCLVDEITYRNNTTVPTTNNCDASCICLSSVVVCKKIKCNDPPNSGCVIIEADSESCCPIYSCEGVDELEPVQTEIPEVQSTPKISEKQDELTERPVSESEESLVQTTEGYSIGTISPEIEFEKDKDISKEEKKPVSVTEHDIEDIKTSTTQYTPIKIEGESLITTTPSIIHVLKEDATIGSQEFDDDADKKYTESLPTETPSSPKDKEATTESIVKKPVEAVTKIPSKSEESMEPEVEKKGVLPSGIPQENLVDILTTTKYPILAEFTTSVSDEKEDKLIEKATYLPPATDSTYHRKEEGDTSIALEESSEESREPSASTTSSVTQEVPGRGEEEPERITEKLEGGEGTSEETTPLIEDFDENLIPTLKPAELSKNESIKTPEIDHTNRTELPSTEESSEVGVEKESSSKPTISEQSSEEEELQSEDLLKKPEETIDAVTEKGTEETIEEIAAAATIKPGKADESVSSVTEKSSKGAEGASSPEDLLKKPEKTTDAVTHKGADEAIDEIAATTTIKPLTTDESISMVTEKSPEGAEEALSPEDLLKKPDETVDVVTEKGTDETIEEIAAAATIKPGKTDESMDIVTEKSPEGAEGASSPEDLLKKPEKTTDAGTHKDVDEAIDEIAATTTIKPLTTDESISMVTEKSPEGAEEALSPEDIMQKPEETIDVTEKGTEEAIDEIAPTTTIRPIKTDESISMVTEKSPAGAEEALSPEDLLKKPEEAVDVVTDKGTDETIEEIAAAATIKPSKTDESISIVTEKSPEGSEEILSPEDLLKKPEETIDVVTEKATDETIEEIAAATTIKPDKTDESISIITEKLPEGAEEALSPEDILQKPEETIDVTEKAIEEAIDEIAPTTTIRPIKTDESISMVTEKSPAGAEEALSPEDLLKKPEETVDVVTEKGTDETIVEIAAATSIKPSKTDESISIVTEKSPEGSEEILSPEDLLKKPEETIDVVTHKGTDEAIEEIAAATTIKSGEVDDSISIVTEKSPESANEPPISVATTAKTLPEDLENRIEGSTQISIKDFEISTLSTHEERYPVDIEDSSTLATFEKVEVEQSTKKETMSSQLPEQATDYVAIKKEEEDQSVVHSTTSSDMDAGAYGYPTKTPQISSEEELESGIPIKTDHIETDITVTTSIPEEISKEITTKMPSFEDTTEEVKVIEPIHIISPEKLPETSGEVLSTTESGVTSVFDQFSQTPQPVPVVGEEIVDDKKPVSTLTPPTVAPEEVPAVGDLIKTVTERIDETVEVIKAEEVTDSKELETPGVTTLSTKDETRKSTTTGILEEHDENVTIPSEITSHPDVTKATAVTSTTVSSYVPKDEQFTETVETERPAEYFEEQKTPTTEYSETIKPSDLEEHMERSTETHILLTEQSTSTRLYPDESSVEVTPKPEDALEHEITTQLYAKEDEEKLINKTKDIIESEFTVKPEIVTMLTPIKEEEVTVKLGDSDKEFNIPESIAESVVPEGHYLEVSSTESAIEGKENKTKQITEITDHGLPMTTSSPTEVTEIISDLVKDTELDQKTESIDIIPSSSPASIESTSKGDESTAHKVEDDNISEVSTDQVEVSTEHIEGIKDISGDQIIKEKIDFSEIAKPESTTKKVPTASGETIRPDIIHEPIDKEENEVAPSGQEGTTESAPLLPPSHTGTIEQSDKLDESLSSEITERPNKTITTEATTSEKPTPHQPSYGQIPAQYPSYSEDDYGEEEESEVFGPGTCRYGGKLFVSAQQIPRDDPCDFCFCFRSDIICLQQSCPPPISGCHEEPIQGFCCPRYECPVSMATVLNVTTSTTTTSTTLPPHFLHHAYNGAATKNGCHIQGKSYKIGDKIDSASGPCMHCTCGGDGQMKCEPKICSPEPMLRQMIAVVASKRR